MHLRSWNLAGLPGLFLAAAVAWGQPTSETLRGLEFRNIGPANMSGRFVDLAVVESDPYVFYAASATGGVWKTVNNGVTFEPVFEREGTHSVGDIAVHQKNPEIVWVGTGERANRQSSSWGDGVYKSTDGGKTWTNMGLAESRHIGRIALHPDDPEIVYVAAMGHLWGDNPERGLYHSTDGGRSWEKVFYVDERTGVADVAIDPSNPEILYAAAYQRQRKAYGFHGGGPGSGLYKSTDGGDSWRELRKGLPEGDYGRIGISIYRRDPRIVYASVEQGLRYTASISYEERKAGLYRSEDRGESWIFMSDWNPRPMYASQPLVDPNDDQRIYMENSFSYSTDGGKTFTVPRQSVHSDDRFLWVDPRDSRHLIKASDGALAISYDQAETWLFVASLPVSQYYRVSVDMARPFRVYGGLQDNGSWVGPSATYRSEGILNEDWTRLGGGDGFLNLVDPGRPDTVYVESQYLGLTRVHLPTLDTRTILPGNDRGFIANRRNWEVWGTDEPEPLLGNTRPYANWDAPLLISPHDSEVLYAGTDRLWRSTDQGYSWTSLGRLTGDVKRYELPIMGSLPDASTPSLDDGIPYWPTLTAIAESYFQQGLLYVGTDDGRLAVSRNGGGDWTDLQQRLPGFPEGAWIAGIEASRFEENTVYVAVNHYRDDDYGNYLYRSGDAGESWTSIAGGLPAGRVVRTVREDPRNPSVLYAGCELGLFVSPDRGGRWIELKNNLPTVAVNDLVVHPRDNDLVLGTHGRGVWILDNVNALQELTDEVLSRPAHLFSVEPAEMIRYRRTKAQAGDMVFEGENPPAGAIIDYYLREPSEEVRLSVHDATGERVADLKAQGEAGINRVVWNLRYPRLSDPAGEEPDRYGRPRRGPEGPWVAPGLYRIRLELGGEASEQPVEVREDPRLRVALEERVSWTGRLRRLAALYERANRWVARLIEARPEESEPDALEKRVRELRRRARLLYGQVMDWTGPLTRDQQAQLAFLRRVAEQVEEEVRAAAPPG